MIKTKYNSQKTEIQDDVNKILALQLAGLGWMIFPCKPDKTPYTAHGKDDATTDTKQLQIWWERWPDALIGIYCEKSGIFALDMDKKDGRDGVKAWAELVDKHGGGHEVAAGPIQETPSGGYHILFKYPKGQAIPNNANQLGQGLDLRSNGYICTGGPYTWLPDHGPESQLTEAPSWLLALIENMKKRPTSQPGPTPVQSNGDAGAYWLRYYQPRATVGNRNNTGLLLALQLSYSGLTMAEAEPIMIEYAHSVPGDGYSEREALASLKTAYSYPRREAAHIPGILIPQNGHPADLSLAPGEPTDAAPDQEREKRQVLTAEYIQVLKALGYTFKMLELDQSIEVNGEKITDALESKIRTQLRDAGYPRVNVARDAYIADAYDHQYNPIRDYLNAAGSEWDGQDHIKALADHFADADDVFSIYLRKWLIGSVARIYQTNTQNRVLVLDGPQDLGKSYFVKWLCPTHLLKYQREGGIQPDNKDHTIALAKSWIWEIAELGSTTRRADLEALKFFLSQMEIQARPAYGRYDLNRPAITSFIATVNSDGAGFLNDPTGSRRFMSCTLSYIAWDYSGNIRRDQVWGQAKALFDQGIDWRMTGEDYERAARINKRYERTNPIEFYLDECLEIQTAEDIEANGFSYVTSKEILERLKEQGVKETERIITVAVSQYLKAKGIENKLYRFKKEVTPGGEEKELIVRGYKGVRLASVFTKKQIDDKRPDIEEGD